MELKVKVIDPLVACIDGLLAAVKWRRGYMHSLQVFAVGALVSYYIRYIWYMVHLALVCLMLYKGAKNKVGTCPIARRLFLQRRDPRFIMAGDGADALSEAKLDESADGSGSWVCMRTMCLLFLGGL